MFLWIFELRFSKHLFLPPALTFSPLFTANHPSFQPSTRPSIQSSLSPSQLLIPSPSQLLSSLPTSSIHPIIHPSLSSLPFLPSHLLNFFFVCGISPPSFNIFRTKSGRGVKLNVSALHVNLPSPKSIRTVSLFSMLSTASRH